MFVDEVKIFVKAGDGGRGCMSFRREKYVPKGGPDGGDGGDGGSVFLEVDPGIHTLLDLTYHHCIVAERGGHGRGKKQSGRRGGDLTIRVPPGTEVRDPDTDSLLADLVSPGERFPAARGGKGGRGNARFATPTDQAPRRAEPGIPGEEHWFLLRLKILADVGIVGLPNAGKSTLLSAISRARPKTAPYPFTTLEPHLGVVEGPAHATFVAADVPGLIEGAHRGHGLGTRFLRHIQRTKVILHMIDISPATGRDPVRDWEIVNREMAAFDPDLVKKPQAVAASKIDLPGADDRLAALDLFCRKNGIDLYPVSALTGNGLPKLIGGLSRLVKKVERKAS